LRLKGFFFLRWAAAAAAVIRAGDGLEKGFGWRKDVGRRFPKFFGMMAYR
jgi:hypothetical protein